MIDDLWHRIETRLNQPVLPDPVSMAVKQAGERWSAGERDEALARLMVAVEGNPGVAVESFWSGRFTLASLALEDGRNDLAERAVLPLIAAEARLSPIYHAEAQHLHGKILDAQNRPDEASEARARRGSSLDRHPNTLQRVLARAAFLRLDRRFGDSLELYRAALPHSGPIPLANRATAHARGAYVALMEGEFRAALDWATQAAALDPETIHAERFLSHVCRLCNRFEQAMDWAEAALERGKRSGDRKAQAEALIELAASLLSSGKPSVALSLLADAETLCPALHAAIWGRANLFVFWERFDLLRDERERTSGDEIWEGPSGCIVDVLLAESEGDFEGALASVERAATQCHSRWDRFHVAGLRARMLVRAGRLDDAEAALRFLDGDRKTFSEPRFADPVYLGPLAALRARQERHDDALDAAKTLLRLGPEPCNVPERWCFVGDRLAALGQKEAARLAWTNATKSDVESPWVQRAAERLAEI